ncbi:ABC transporter substrate-binding protein [Halorientalis regularis]|uniref:Protein kinase domain-containing protein n=1 Tax=Halorientalis regularis TaxID=660518 RepID=A0A1G7TV45_9EURY|nr:ABC transporter substrate-binding protein [Halorientalis regularis]SDG38609.1 Protein kinase domain-containing protein [Halorientalis regularis]
MSDDIKTLIRETDVITAEIEQKGDYISVYQAELADTSDRVRILTLPPHIDDKEVATAFNRVAGGWEKANTHPNIVTVYDRGNEPQPWIAIEQVDKQTLKEAQSDLSPDEVRSVVIDIAEALRNAGLYNTHHLDLKPDNIWVVSDGEGVSALVDEWGLERVVRSTVDEFDVTPFTAPEVIKEPETRNERTDVFGLGALTYFALTGNIPFTSGKDIETSIRNGTVTPPSDADESLSATIDDIVMQALATDPSKRPDSVYSFKQSFDRAFSPSVETDPGVSEGATITENDNENNQDSEQNNGSVITTRRVALSIVGGAVGVGGLVVSQSSNNANRNAGAGAIPEEMTIGVLAPAPENNPIGESIANSAKLAVNRIESSSELLPQKNINVSIMNTEGTPSTGRQRYRELAQNEGLHLTTGVFRNDVLLQLMNLIAEEQTVHMTTGAATPTASNQVHNNYEQYKYHFRTGPINNYHRGQNMVDFLEAQRSNLGWDSVALLVEDYEWTNPVQQALNDHIGDLEVEVIMEQRYASGTQNFGPIYDSVEDSGADAAFVAMAHTGTAAVVQWAQDSRPFEFGGIHVPSQLPAYYNLTNGACRYTVTQNTATPQNEITDKTLQYAEDYNSQYGGYPVYAGYNTYDAILQWANVVTKHRTVDANEIVVGLENSSYIGTTGTLNYYGPDHKYAHDIRYNFTTNSSPESGINPVWQQWQEDDGRGVQEIIHPTYVESSTYQRPPWI